MIYWYINNIWIYIYIKCPSSRTYPNGCPIQMAPPCLLTVSNPMPRILKKLEKFSQISPISPMYSIVPTWRWPARRPRTPRLSPRPRCPRPRARAGPAAAGRPVPAPPATPPAPQRRLRSRRPEPAAPALLLLPHCCSSGRSR